MPSDNKQKCSVEGCNNPQFLLGTDCAEHIDRDVLIRRYQSLWMMYHTVVSTTPRDNLPGPVIVNPIPRSNEQILLTALILRGDGAEKNFISISREEILDVARFGPAVLAHLECPAHGLHLRLEPANEGADGDSKSDEVDVPDITVFTMSGIPEA